MSTLNINDSNLSAAAFKELEELCTSDKLSIDELQKKLNQYKSLIINNADQHHNSVLFHQACMNKNVTLDIIQELLIYFPNAVKTLGAFSSPGIVDNDEESKAYPLHFCTYNPNCPSEVIQLLIEKYPAALTKTCFVNHGVEFGDIDAEDCIKGLPLHYYLSRKNIDINTVQMMVNAFSQALQNTDNGMKYSPLHIAISNPYIRVHEHIPYLLTRTESSVIRHVDSWGRTILHIACSNKGVGLEVVERLCNMSPESITSSDDFGDIPLHALCQNQKIDEMASLEILRFMLSMHPDLPRYVSDGHLPIHHAVHCKSTSFCKELIDACPATLRAEACSTRLPLHSACEYGKRYDTVDTIRYMLELYPESIQARIWQSRQGHIFSGDGYLPIHCAAARGRKETIEFLLSLDPDAASKKVLYYQQHPGPGVSISAKDSEGALPLHIAIFERGSLDSIQALYDDYPEALFVQTRQGDTPLDMLTKRHRTRTTNDAVIGKFLRSQLEYAQMAKDIEALSTIDENGWLPLHQALKGDASLGSIKLLLKGNPSAFVVDNKGASPLHIACELSSLNVVEYLMDLYEQGSDTKTKMMLCCANCGKGEEGANSLKVCTACKMVKYCNVACQKAHRPQHKKECKKRAAELRVESLFKLPKPKEELDIYNHCDTNKDTILHYACRGGNLDIVQYLLTSHVSLVASASVNENVNNELPFHLLCQAGGEDKVDKAILELEHIETIWLMLLVNPEVVAA